MPHRIGYTRRDGKPDEYLAWSDQELTDMAQVTPEDQRAADRYWRKLLPRRFRDLLDAQSVRDRAVPLE
ncbi:MAG TPA: hypothetical protein VFB50_21325 [Chloroflexota bacterium]|nr:hypothetical protein [Chloroflexota bacterium]